MIDFAQLRRAMVDGQIRVNDVTDPAIIAAMLHLPRERFVPESLRQLAYIDDDLLLRPASAGSGPRYLIEPMVLAKLVQALELGEQHKVLDVGAATGYGAALLANLAREVIALEEDADLAASARITLRELGAANVTVVDGPLPAGWPTQAPYDAILVEGAVEAAPQAILGQLREGGVLGTVLRSGAASRATIFTRAGDRFPQRTVFDAAIPPLPGFAAPRGFVF
jgi:protein-L-isoaspartate(D-aspartate) O-methyltransferase